jgi:RNA polymerase sigma-70 factor (ECF subfamily)
METPLSKHRDEDADLTARLRRCEKDAVQDLYMRYVDRLYSLVFYQVGRNKHVTEDIVQETFLAALNSVNRYRGQSKPFTWLCGIAYHKIGDFYRRQRRGAEDVGLRSATEVEKIPAREEPIVDKFESEETKEAVEQVLAGLPLHYRQVLLFKYVEEMPVLEIGEIMGRSSKSVEGLLTRARKTLQASLDDSSKG